MTKENKVNSILFVEDDPLNQTVLIKLLKHFSHKLYTASNGEEGLVLYKLHNPQIVISDIRMPKMNGIEMVKEIKKINKNVHVIFTTAFSESEFFLDAIKLSVDAYLIKPIKINDLIDKIVSIVENESLKEELKLKETLLIQQNKVLSLTELLINIAHHWRQPLSVISANANVILADLMFGKDIPKDHLKDTMTSICDQSQYLSNIIDNFKKLYKIDMIESSFKLSDIVNDCLIIEKMSLEDFGIEVILNKNNDIVMEGKSTLLTQVILSLINNAKDAFLLNDALDKKIIIIEMNQADKYFELSIKDNAGGIKNKHLEKVFEPYFTTKHKSQGTGLSLYLAYNIMVNNFNGSISAHNKVFEYEGREYNGAKFILKFKT